MVRPDWFTLEAECEGPSSRHDEGSEIEDSEEGDSLDGFIVDDDHCSFEADSDSGEARAEERIEEHVIGMFKAGVAVEVY